MEPKRILFVLMSVLMGTIGWSQTGPGGVGSDDGSSSLEIWLSATDVDADGDQTDNPPNGSQISLWADHSGHLNNFTQSGANRPTYNTSGTFSAVNFNASLSTAQFMVGAISGSFSNASAFFVLNPVNSGRSNSLFDNGSHSLRVEQWSNTGRVGFTRYGVGDYSTAISSPFGTNSIISYHKNGGQNNILVQVNGSSQILGVGSAAAGIPYNRIGRNSNNADEASGDFFEIILYSGRLNDAQRIIVDNYLSSKYGGIGINVDVYDEDDAVNGNFDHDVAGIGRIDASNLHTDAQGTGIVRVSGPTDMGDNEFLIWGHDDGSLFLNNTSDIPTNSTHARLDRVWRVSESNTSGSSVDLGAIDIRVDMVGVTGFSTAYAPQLLVDTDNDGLFNDEVPISTAISLGSDQYRFNGVTAISDNARFTFAIGRRTVITNKNITYRVNKN